MKTLACPSRTSVRVRNLSPRPSGGGGGAALQRIFRHPAGLWSVGGGAPELGRISFDCSVVGASSRCARAPFARPRPRALDTRCAAAKSLPTIGPLVCYSGSACPPRLALPRRRMSRCCCARSDTPASTRSQWWHTGGCVERLGPSAESLFTFEPPLPTKCAYPSFCPSFHVDPAADVL